MADYLKLMTELQKSLNSSSTLTEKGRAFLNLAKAYTEDLWGFVRESDRANLGYGSNGFKEVFHSVGKMLDAIRHYEMEIEEREYYHANPRPENRQYNILDFAENPQPKGDGE